MVFLVTAYFLNVLFLNYFYTVHWARGGCYYCTKLGRSSLLHWARIGRHYCAGLEEVVITALG